MEPDKEPDKEELAVFYPSRIHSRESQFTVIMFFQVYLQLNDNEYSTTFLWIGCNGCLPSDIKWNMRFHCTSNDYLDRRNTVKSTIWCGFFIACATVDAATSRFKYRVIEYSGTFPVHTIIKFTELNFEQRTATETQTYS